VNPSQTAAVHTTAGPAAGRGENGAPAQQNQGERIRRRTDFERIYKQGLKLGSRYMTVFLLRTDLPVSRLGIAATRKLGGAVVRNRAKRRSRALFQRQKPHAGLDLVIVPKREFLSAEFTTLERDYTQLVSRRQDRAPRARAR
jgi:ribonuclease P protein component